MTTYVSVVVAVPADQHDQACAIATGLGWQPEDGDSFNMPASETGKAPATWFFARSQASEGALAILQTVKAKAPDAKEAAVAVVAEPIKGGKIGIDPAPLPIAKVAPTVASIVELSKADAWPLEAPLSGTWDDYDLTDEAVVDVGVALVLDVKTQKELDALGWSYGDHVQNVMKAQGVKAVTPASM